MILGIPLEAAIMLKRSSLPWAHPYAIELRRLYRNEKISNG
jgi:hypothetical protein